MHRLKILFGFLCLFVAYQLPQGLMIKTGRISLFLASTALVVSVAYGIARWTSGQGWSEFYLPLEGRAIPLLFSGVSLGLAAQAVGIWLGIYLGYVRVEKVLGPRSMLPLLFLVYAVSFISSAAEDIFTRAYILRHWPSANTRWFVPISAIIYVLNHIYVLRTGPALWSFLLIIGLALAWPLWRTAQMWFTVGAHWGWNLAYHAADRLLITRSIDPHAALWSTSIGALLLLGLLISATPLIPRARAT